MDGHEIASPPYPGEGSGTAAIAVALAELHRWVAACLPALTRALGIEPMSPPPPLPADVAAAYRLQPVAEQFRHYVTLRRLREAWDAVVRDYEGEWDSADGVRAQALVVGMASSLLADAFMLHEAREARARHSAHRMQRNFEHLYEALSDISDPHHEPEGR